MYVYMYACMYVCMYACTHNRICVLGQLALCGGVFWVLVVDAYVYVVAVVVAMGCWCWENVPLPIIYTIL